VELVEYKKTCDLPVINTYKPVMCNRDILEMYGLTTEKILEKADKLLRS
jgi:hypothetical protein